MNNNTESAFSAAPTFEGNISTPDVSSTAAPKPKKPRGFAGMSKDKVKEIASKGGKIAHQMGRAHKWATGTEEAKAAGRKGGIAPHKVRGRAGKTKTGGTVAAPESGVRVAIP